MRVRLSCFEDRLCHVRENHVGFFGNSTVIVFANPILTSPHTFKISLPMCMNYPGRWHIFTRLWKYEIPRRQCLINQKIFRVHMNPNREYGGGIIMPEE